MTVIIAVHNTNDEMIKQDKPMMSEEVIRNVTNIRHDGTGQVHLSFYMKDFQRVINVRDIRDIF